MINTKQKPIEESLVKAFQKLNAKYSNSLYSYTEKINLTNDPIAIFANIAPYKGTRFFWTTPDDRLCLIGAGAVECIKDEADAYISIEKQWDALLQNGYVDNPYKLPGTGPLLLGGFSFNPNEVSREWRNFGKQRMVVPEFLLAIRGDEAYLTYTTKLEESSLMHTYVNKLDAFKNTLAKQRPSFTQASIIKKEAVLQDEWKETIRKATSLIRENTFSKVVLARELKVKFDREVSIPTVLLQLREQQKHSYLFAIESGDDCFLGATPERLVKVEANELLSTCLAGTAPRGETMAEDEEIGNQLLTDEKNREEHAFVVRMIQEAIEGCCDEVTVPDSPVLYQLKNLQHLYTPVKGKLAPEYSILDVVERLHPTPAMGGVPREKALQFIQDEEALKRGWYAAPIGWVDASGNGEFAVAIRSGLVKGKDASLFAGCGIVKDSDPEAEYAETEMKFKPMLHALGGES